MATAAKVTAATQTATVTVVTGKEIRVAAAKVAMGRVVMPSVGVEVEAAPKTLAGRAEDTMVVIAIEAQAAMKGVATLVEYLGAVQVVIPVERWAVVMRAAVVPPRAE